MGVVAKVGETGSALNSATNTSATTKSVGTQTTSKSSESFTLTTGKIQHDSPNITATNLKDALDEVAGQIAKSTSAPSSPLEGELWYDTDDDKFYVRDEASWNEVITNISGTVDGGSY